ncbi:hypothetical protein GG804_27005 [Sphingomonas histidinilytica]|uniref:hypothetical protein n=1 Tax=Rhizorhabdus histidinilytica TaxID=439228 RepID=UPI001ADAB75B|nr:hypothetical protein [Rhizorhabdus histidinilytica]MBO9380417.1 hypothetical protein [Rhizorhabdus histidinilytica]
MTPENLRAFPSAAIDDQFGGMTLRDWFAGQALPAIITATSAGQHMPGNGFNDERSIQERMAADAYKIADAMLAERAKGCGL